MPNSIESVVSGNNNLVHKQQNHHNIKITEFIGSNQRRYIQITDVGSNQLGKKILGSNQMNSIELTFESLKFY